jgi:uncharacterized membrane protein YphA (DoxX/SURF4 family)
MTMESTQQLITPIARAALGVLFLVSGVFKIMGFAGVAG